LDLWSRIYIMYESTLIKPDEYDWNVLINENDGNVPGEYDINGLITNRDKLID